jgi:tRNA dimethylallyltransferase
MGAERSRSAGLNPSEESVRPVVPIIVGPTASGKTKLSLELARRHDRIEIISADSRQVYIGMDIGTAKVTAAERSIAPHHLIDIVPPTVNLTAGDYALLARDIVREIVSRGSEPLLVGGSGFYISAFIEGLGAPTVDEEVYAGILGQVEREGYESVYAELLRVDPIAAHAHSPNNRVKVYRALACFRQTGRPYSSFAGASAIERSLVRPRYLGVAPPRQELYDRINQRVVEMVEHGLVKEVKRLLDAGIPPDAPGFRTVGYAEALKYLSGEYTLDEMIHQTQQASRRYAKRQMTWFRRIPDVHWMNEPDIDRADRWYSDVVGRQGGTGPQSR